MRGWLLLVPLFCNAQTLAPPFDDPSNWLSYDRDNTARRYSPLDQIRPANIKRLATAWVAQFPRIPNRSEATPLVRNGVMYVTAGGEEAHAIDARTGRFLWTFHYTPPGTGAAAPRLNWNRGFAISGNRLFMATTDCSLIAIDARNGSLLWRMQLADPKDNYGTNAAPLIVNNLVLLGVRGGDLGHMRGFVDAYEVETGRRAWRFYTIPAPGEPGSETWPKTDVWKSGGGATWTAGSYDPELNLVYWPVGNAGPSDFDGRNRAGDNLYTCSVVALDPRTGKRVWHYQFTPHDLHDWDANETLVLADAVWKGKPRKLIMQANRNAFFYVLDRTNGEVLLAEPFAKQTWAKRILPNGRPEMQPNTEPTQKGNPACPDLFGGTNWQAPAFNPAVGLFYVISRDACGFFKTAGFTVDLDPKAPAPQESLKAIDIQTGAVRWAIPFRGNQEFLFAGAMTTAGGLVFYSSREGQFMAVDARSGEMLWHFNTGGTVRASPMSYAVDGRQYIAITTKGGVFAFALLEE
jgi:alcohol dehydrogenase (cytochrome c)